VDKVSDTPRTDAAVVSAEYIRREMDYYTHKFVLADHMRDVEHELAEQKEQFRVLEDEMLVMMDERNAAVLDAERYRWLRERHWEDANMFVVSGGHSRVKLATNCPSGEFLDAAIDAAMKEMK
jgi:putative intracellular protease/amidase